MESYRKVQNIILPVELANMATAYTNKRNADLSGFLNYMGNNVYSENEKTVRTFLGGRGFQT